MSVRYIPIYPTAQLVGAITDRPRALNERPYESYRKVFDKSEFVQLILVTILGMRAITRDMMAVRMISGTMYMPL